MTNFKAEIKSIVIELLEDLKELFGDENELEIMTIEVFFRSMSEDKIAENIINHVLPHEKKILNRDKKFFKDNRSLFSGLPENRVEYYTNKLSSPDFSPEDDELLFRYFETLVSLAKKIKKEK